MAQSGSSTTAAPQTRVVTTRLAETATVQRQETDYTATPTASTDPVTGETVYTYPTTTVSETVTREYGEFVTETTMGGTAASPTFARSHSLRLDPEADLSAAATALGAHATAVAAAETAMAQAAQPAAE